jgi:ribosomal peptide maturation radical SAM protein 1
MWPEPPEAPSAPRPSVDSTPGRGSRRVLMVCMPYQNVALSSLSTSLLSTLLRAHGADVEEAYLHFRFAELLGRTRYQRIAEGGGQSGLVGELLFAEGFRGALDPSLDERLRDRFGPPRRRAALLAEYAEHALARVNAAAPDIVGFTTSFHQVFPSLWLARLIKRRWPSTTVVFGGAACAAPMGARLAESYAEIDHVVDGFGEVPLLRLATHGNAGLPRVISSAEPVALDELPIPDYTPFMEQARAYSADPAALMLAFESSRGCWWGEKTHCTFCGLNQLGMAYNAKSSERVVVEVRALWDRHRTHLFATDTILSRVHLKEVMPRLASYADRPAIFYEVKANMTSAEVRALREAGVLWIQPGVESLSSRLLRHLRKGVKTIQNVALLKWCQEEGIAVSWNLLCGIPGEAPEDYDDQLRLMRRIPQLPPPQGVSPVRIDRYAPYFARHAEYGWPEIAPFEEYRLLHREMGDAAVRDVAYYFTGRGGQLDVGLYLSRLQRGLARWRAAHARGDGLFWTKKGGLLVARGDRVSQISGDERLAAVVARSHDIVSVDRLFQETGCDDDLLDALIDLGVVFREGNLVVNLAVRSADPESRSQAAVTPARARRSRPRAPRRATRLSA